MAKTPLTRASIIYALTTELQPVRYVHAFWEAGAAAFDRVDEWSDIDLYIVVDETAVPQTFDIAEKALTALSPIRLTHVVSWPAASGIHQKFYHLRGTSEYLLVDLAVMTLSAPDKFLVREIHGEAVFFFNKGAVVQIPPLDRDRFAQAVIERRKRLQERMEMFGPFVQKELLRGHGLEALEFYRGIVLAGLVEALRMRHDRLHYDFRMRYVYQELPPDVVHRLEDLAFVKGPDDLAAKYREALIWFNEVIPDHSERAGR